MSACEAEGDGSIPFGHPWEMTNDEIPNDEQRRGTRVHAGGIRHLKFDILSSLGTSSFVIDKEMHHGRQRTQRPTLVLNRNWQPVNVATVARSLVLVVERAARVVDPEDYQHYTWADWSQLIPQADELFIQAVEVRLRVPEVIALTEYDRVPDERRDVQPAQHLQARPVHVPVLRCAAGQRGADDRPRRAAVAGRPRPGRTACWRAWRATSARPTARRQQAGMPLRKPPVRPTWKPLYARHDVRIESWSKFVSEAYWNVELE